MEELIVYAESPKLLNNIKQLAEIIHDCPLEFSMNIPQVGDFLLMKDDGLWLISNKFKPFHFDKFYAQFILRRKESLSRELLIQAIKISGNPQDYRIADAYAGLGRDSIIMALFGFKVVMFENNPYLAIALNYMCGKFSLELNQNLSLIYADNTKYLQVMSEQFDVIYVDPMFADAKSALSKKEIQIIDLFLQLVSRTVDLAGKEIIPDKIFSIYRLRCHGKIIIKRDNKQQQFIVKPKPTYVKTGTTIRFDVYQQ